MPFRLTTDNRLGLEDFLRDRGLLRATERVVATERPGEGNMNCTVRAVFKSGSFIVKQSRDHVVKYPMIPAPADRTLVEAQFYRLAAPHTKLRRRMPELLHVDRGHCLIVLQDLGSSADFLRIYQRGEELGSADFAQLTDFLRHLHANCRATDRATAMANREMRALNAEHIFRFPFEAENEFNLDDVTQGLDTAARAVQQDDELKKVVGRLERIYLSDGEVLLHGDYYPGSWLATDIGVKIIDPEFCFYGPAEFDWGVMLAHLIIAQQEELAGRLLAELPVELDRELTIQFGGVEILRRLMGLAQLPLPLSLREKSDLLLTARRMVCSPALRSLN